MQFTLSIKVTGLHTLLKKLKGGEDYQKVNKRPLEASPHLRT